MGIEAEPSWILTTFRGWYYSPSTNQQRAGCGPRWCSRPGNDQATFVLLHPCLPHLLCQQLARGQARSSGYPGEAAVLPPRRQESSYNVG
jgi:hypothetical protein